MHNSMIKFALLGSAALLAPMPAMAQQIASEWSPYDDSGAVASEQSDAPNPAPEKKHGKGRKDGPRVAISPYIEAQQVLLADLKNGGDVLTYSTIAAGIDASISTRRAEGQINVRYERLIGYDSDTPDQNIVSGVARAGFRVTPNLSIEAGGLAARSTVDGRGSAPSNLVGTPDNVSQVYSIYAGPTFTAQAGPLTVDAAYRAGYTKVQDKQVGSLPPGQERVGTFDSSVNQMATASVGMQPGPLPIGWSVGVGYEREDAKQLDSRFEGKYARADVTVPISGGLAVVGGVGYEKIEISERDALRDGFGDPIIDANGHYVTDPSSPRLTAWETDGVIWDAGLMWRPSDRTSFAAYYGHRYGSDTYYGSLTYNPGRDWAVNVAAYDTVSGLGGMINDNLSNLPPQFRASRNPLSGDISSCAFAQSGGFCFNDALQQASAATFRQRGITAALSSSQGGWDTGIAAGYSRRKFLVSSTGAQADLAGVVDQNYFAVAYLGRDLDRRTRFESNVYANLFNPGLAGAGDVLSTGVNAAFYRQIIRGLSATAAVGIDAYKQEDFNSELTGSALLGLRYTFN